MTLGRFWRIHGSRVLFLLAVLSLVAAGVYGQLAGSVNGIDKYLPEALPEASEFQLPSNSDGNLYVGEANGSQIGYVTVTEGQGYGGTITILMGWSLDGTILSMFVLEHREDKPWFDKLYDQEFFDQYVGRQYSEPLRLDKDIDAVSGSTVSCKGVAIGVQMGRALVAEQLGDPYPVPEEPIKFGIAEVMVLIGLSSVVTLRVVPALKSLRWARYLTLAFGLGVIGLWLVVSLSLTNFAAVMLGYVPPWQSHLIIYILVFGVLGLAVVLGKNFYCFWLCPFAALQEGLHFIGKRSVKPDPTWFRILRNARYVLLWLALFLVLLLGNSTISVFEPWNTLFPLSGTMVAWLLVLVTLLAALFIHNLYCYYVCPVGAVIDIVLLVRREVRKLWSKTIKSRVRGTALKT